MPILYGVSFPEPLMTLPGKIQKGIPGNQSWDRWPGWSVKVSGNRVLITQEPLDLTDENVSGVPPSARDEKQMRIIYSVPVTMAILHYLDLAAEGRGTSEKSPSPALVVALEERKKRPPSAPVAAAPVTYQGPPVTPVRRAQPPFATRPVTPPPSTIVMDEEEAPP